MTDTTAASSSPGGSGEGDATTETRPELNPLLQLIPFMLRYPWRLGLTVAFLLVAAVASLAIPVAMGRVVDQGFIDQNLENVAAYGWAIIAIAGVLAIASGARFYLISVIGERVLTDLRTEVFDHLLTLDATFFDTTRVGELTSRLNGDVATIRGAVGSSASLALRSLVTIIGAIIMMALTSPALTLAVVVIVPAIVFPIIALARRLRKMSRRTQDALADLSAMATETLGATKTVKAFGQEEPQSKTFSYHAEQSYSAEVKRLMARSALVSLVIFLGTAAIVALVWWGAQSVFSGAVTAGQLTQFMIFAIMAAGALTNVSEVFGSLQQVAGATERLMEILATDPALPDPAMPQALPEPPLGTVAFEKVRFTYSNRERETVLSDISFKIGKGERVALVGPSGAGKSTVFALILRFYDVDSGKVLLDGIDVRKLSQTDLRSRFAYVEQEAVMFAGSVSQNIRFGKPDASDEAVMEAARAALVDEFARNLPDGYDTLIGERGVMLSGGQRQRIAIARALLRNAPILLLDEATSALDAQSEKLVQQALEHLMKGRTAFVIAHRLATIRDADRILVLENGKLIDEGTHDQLVKKGGRYAELAKLQFRTESLA